MQSNKKARGFALIEKIKRGYSLAGNYLQYFIHKHFYLIGAILITAISLTARFLVALHPTRDVVVFVFNFYRSNAALYEIFSFVSV